MECLPHFVRAFDSKEFHKILGRYDSKDFRILVGYEFQGLNSLGILLSKGIIYTLEENLHPHKHLCTIRLYFHVDLNTFLDKLVKFSKHAELNRTYNYNLSFFHFLCFPNVANQKDLRFCN
jgi:hypothetical protein